MPGTNPSPFRHLQLVLHRRAKAKPKGGGSDRSKSQVTIRNLADRRGHAQRVRLSLESLRAMWSKTKDTRVSQGLPPLPDSVPLFLQVDSGVFDLDALDSLGIELALECEGGYLLCASRTADLNELEQAIAAFKQSRGKSETIAKIHVIEVTGERRRNLVVGSSLQRAMSTSTGEPLDAVVVLSTNGIRAIPDEPRIKDDRYAFLASLQRWETAVAQNMKNWILRFGERVTNFSDLVAKSGGEILDRSDISLFLNSSPHQIFALADIEPRAIAILSERLRRTCRVISQDSSDGGNTLIEILVENLTLIPPEPALATGNKDPEYEKTWSLWVQSACAIRANEWASIFDNLRHDVRYNIVDLGGELHQISGDDIDMLQPPDQVVIKIRAAVDQVKLLCDSHPYVVRMDIAQPMSALSPAAAFGLDPEVPPVTSPSPTDPRVCVIDSGIEKDHPIIRPSIEVGSLRSLLPGDSRADVDSNGHGTAVAGAVLFPDGMRVGIAAQSTVWIQSMRILNKDNQIPAEMAVEMVTWKAIQAAKRDWGTKIFNLSANYQDPDEKLFDGIMDSWSAHLDWISASDDVLVIASAGNIRPHSFATQRLNIAQKGEDAYPAVMATSSCRLTPPALSWNAIVVGSICPDAMPIGQANRIGQPLYPSPFSRGGPGVWECVKPDVVEIAGDWVENKNPLGDPETDTGLMLMLPQAVSVHGSAKGPAAGTSYAAPKVSRVAAEVLRALPNASPLLLRTLVLHSARWPTWLNALPDADKTIWMRHIGFGIPSIELATSNSPFRVTYVTSGRDRIGIGQIAAWKIPIHPDIRRRHDVRIRIDVTTCCLPIPHATRKGRHYGSLWVDWKASGRGQGFPAFVNKWTLDAEAEEGAESGERLQWTLGGRREREGQIAGVTGSTGSVHRDWAELTADDLPRDYFGVAVRGHAGWERHPHASVPYALAVTFSVIDEALEIYNLQVQAQVAVESQVEERIEVRE